MMLYLDMHTSTTSMNVSNSLSAYFYMGE